MAFRGILENILLLPSGNNWSTVMFEDPYQLGRYVVYEVYGIGDSNRPMTLTHLCDSHEKMLAAIAENELDSGYRESVVVEEIVERWLYKEIV
jgi:hypothetical protein